MSIGKETEMASVRPGQALGGAALAGPLATVGAALLGFVLPVLMVVANKSAPVALGLAALVLTLSACMGGHGPALVARYRRLLRAPTALLTGAVVALAVASFAWSIDPAMTRRGLVEGVPELVFAGLVAAAWPLVGRPGDRHWLLAGVAAAGALIVVEHLAGMPLHILARARAEAWDLKRSAMPPLFLLWPALVVLLSGWRLAPALGLVLAVAAGIAAAHAGAAAAALAAGLVLAGLALLAPRVTLAALAAALVALLVAAPWTGTILGRVLPSDTAEVLREEHAAHRMVIWNAFEERGFDRPLLGHGFDTSFSVGAHPRPDGRPPPPGSAKIVDFHPHDVVLQVWIEFGALGLALAGLVLALMLGRLWRERGLALAGSLGLLASVLGIGLLDLSAWQPWWIASIAVALLWLGRLRPSRI